MELLTVIAIIGVLIALLLPAVQSARESGRRSACSNKLRQLALGCLNYQSAAQAYPPAFTDAAIVNPTDTYLSSAAAASTGAASAYTAPWSVRILPFTGDLARHASFSMRPGTFGGDFVGYPTVAGNNRTAAYTVNGDFQCPSHKNSTPTTPNTDYFGVSGGGVWSAPPGGRRPSDGFPWFTANGNFYFNNGVIVINGRLRPSYVRDGTSKQFMLAETRYQWTLESENAWAIGTNNLFYVNRISRPSWAGTARSSITVFFVGSTAGAAVNSVNASDFVDTAAYPPSYAPASIPAAEQLRVFGSYHPGGCNMAFADGSVQFFEQTVDIGLFRRLGTRADGNPGGY